MLLSSNVLTLLTGSGDWVLSETLKPVGRFLVMLTVFVFKEIFFVYKYIKIIFFLFFLKFIFDINIIKKLKKY
jgi:hypothetical protein